MLIKNLPQKMQAVLLDENGRLKVDYIPLSLPGPGQVLIRMAAAPINPSDLGFLKGSYGVQKQFPVVPGFEGSGTVIAAGPGLIPRLWSGRRVTCSASKGGTWAEFLLAPAATCFPLAKHLSLEQGATLIVNPLTALAFFDIAKRGKHAAIISNAAAGALGQMILRLGQTVHMPVIHIVRRKEQVELLRSLGGEYILNSTDSDFDDQLRTLSWKLMATLILDPVAGEQTHHLLDAAPNGSTALIYGFLSGSKEDNLSGNGSKRVEGFYLPDWIAKKSLLKVFLDMQRVQRLAAHELQTTIHKRLPLSEVLQAIVLYQTNPTAGKILLVADNEKIPGDLL